ncbi:MAG: flagellar hook-associated protein FlgL [Chthonomonadaceae bacterium]|nr:flagellar hook-associated protein FlgL [Chthonomonadaceae bacterium]
MTRVSSFQVANESLYGIQSAYSRFERVSAQLSTGKQVNNPSDDPVGTSQALDYRQQIAEIDQFGRNIDQAKGFMSQTESSLSSINTLVRSARSIAVQGANDTNTQDTRDALAAQIDNIIQQVGAIGNTQYAGRYLFAGQQTQTAPMVNTGSGVYTYSGGTVATQDDKLIIDVGRDEAMKVNTTGEETLMPLLNSLKSLRDHLSTGNTQTISRTDIANMDTGLGKITEVRADMGAKIQRLELTKSRNDQSKLNFTKFISDIEDTDTAKAVVEYQTAQTTYQAALQTTAKVFQYSLLNFIS